MGDDAHVETPCGVDEKGEQNARRPHFLGAAFSKTLLIWLFSVVVGHGATHHRRTSDDGKWRAVGSGSGSWRRAIQPNGWHCQGDIAFSNDADIGMRGENASTNSSEAGDAAMQIVFIRALDSGSDD